MQKEESKIEFEQANKEKERHLAQLDEPPIHRHLTCLDSTKLYTQDGKYNLTYLK